MKNFCPPPAGDRVKILGSFASACENPRFRKNFLNLTNIVLHYIRCYSTVTKEV